MEFLRIRNLDIDVIPNGEPFIRLTIEKVIAEGDTITQVIGNFDKMYKRLSDVATLPLGTIADDGVMDAVELYTSLATVAYIWVIEKHGGTMINGKLVIKE